MSDDLAPAWRALGARPKRRPRGSRAAWRLSAPRTSPVDWRIEASHGEYLGNHPYNCGEDAWRISVQRHDIDRDVFVETDWRIATSEIDALRQVRRIAEQMGDES